VCVCVCVCVCVYLRPTAAHNKLQNYVNEFS